MKDLERNIRLTLLMFVVSIIDILVIEKDSNYDYSSDMAPVEKGKLTRGGPHVLAEYLTANPGVQLRKFKKTSRAMGYYYQEGWLKSRLFYLVYCPHCGEYIAACRAGFAGYFKCYNCLNKFST